jgi:hypothetical protein
MITSAYCTSFKKQLLEGAHDFRVGGNVFKIALYTEAANLNSNTTAYTTVGEIVGLGYTAGGLTLTQSNPVEFGASGIVTFSNVSWTGATIAARGALIYNSTPVHTYTNPACIVLDFGITRAAINNTFEIRFPAATDQTAIIRVY